MQYFLFHATDIICNISSGGRNRKHHLLIPIAFVDRDFKERDRITVVIFIRTETDKEGLSRTGGVICKRF